MTRPGGEDWVCMTDPDCPKDLWLWAPKRLAGAGLNRAQRRAYGSVEKLHLTQLMVRTDAMVARLLLAGRI